MIKIVGNDIMRETEKIGWIADNDIYNYEGKKIGYFTENEVYDFDGKRLAKISGNYVYSGEHQLELEDITDDIVGVGLSNSCRVAIATFFGS